MRRKLAALLGWAVITASAVAVTNDQIAVLRQEMDRAPAKEQQIHLTTTLETLRLFAAAKNLPEPLSDEPMRTDIWGTWNRTCRLAEAYNITPLARLSVDPNDPSSRQIQEMMQQAGDLLRDTEKAMIREHIANLLAPLKAELAKEMAKPTATYITAGGVQKEAVTEKTLRLAAQIQGIEASGPILADEIHPLYRTARADVIGQLQGCDAAQARRVSDNGLDRLWELREKKLEAAGRKNQQRQRVEQINQSRRPARLRR